jgi:DNA-binding MarR family transcriptional regulator
LRKKASLPRSELLRLVGHDLGRAISTRSVMLNQVIADRLGINTTDLRCLDVLDRNSESPMTAGKLAELTGLSTGATTDVIDRLERAGFVLRERSASDRRQVLIRLTPAHAERVAPLYDGIQAAMAKLVASYTSDELAVIHDFLSRSIETAGREADRLRGIEPPAAA